MAAPVKQLSALRFARGQHFYSSGWHFFEAVLHLGVSDNQFNRWVVIVDNARLLQQRQFKFAAESSDFVVGVLMYMAAAALPGV